MPNNDFDLDLNTKIFGKKIFVFETIDSTNTCARLLAECGVEEGTIVIAEEQTDGRGRLKRKWLSEREKNLLFSVIFSPKLKERNYYLIPLMVSVSIIDSIKKNIPGCHVTLKWPNDILLVTGEKIGGILTELTRTIENELRIIVGIGLNINQTQFPSSISSVASSIKLSTGENVDRKVLLRDILIGIESSYGLFNSDSNNIINRWKTNCEMFGKPIRVQQGKENLYGICRDIDSEGALLVEDENGKVHRVVAGDVTSVTLNSQQTG